MAAKKGEQFETRMSNEHRVKIQKSNILNALIEHTQGEREMSSSQVQAGLGLLKKALPDLAAVDVSGSMTHEVGDSVAQLLSRIAENGRRLSE